MRRVWPWLPAALLAALLVGHGALLASGGLNRVIGWMFLTQLVPVAGAFACVFGAAEAVWRQRLSPPVAATLALGALAVAPGISGFGLWPLPYPEALAPDGPAATVRLPTDLPMVVLWGGDTLATNQHRTDPAQRWAYDLAIEPVLVGSPNLRDYGCFGMPVLAPAAGTVTLAADGQPDATPNTDEPDTKRPEGNFVGLRLADGTYLLVEHLQQGTVAVKVGEVVAAGQPIGACGSSGDAREPHVHVHHQLQDPALVGSVAEGLPLFFGDTGGDPMPKGGIGWEGGRAVATGARVQHRD